MAKKSIVKSLRLVIYDKTFFRKEKIQHDYILFTLNTLENFVLILFSNFLGAKFSKLKKLFYPILKAMLLEN